MVEHPSFHDGDPGDTTEYCGVTEMPEVIISTPNDSHDSEE